MRVGQRLKTDSCQSLPVWGRASYRGCLSLSVPPNGDHEIEYRPEGGQELVPFCLGPPRVGVARTDVPAGCGATYLVGWIEAMGSPRLVGVVEGEEHQDG